MDRLHLGVQLSPRVSSWPALRDAALRVEALGYDSLWTADHLVAWSGSAPVLECWQVLAALGALTRRVRIGALVSPVGFRHPALLAKMAATLDHVTDGRAILGLGAGGYEREYKMFGLAFGPPAARVERLAEAAEICRRLLAEPRVSFAGRHYVLQEAVARPAPLQPRLPIMIAGGGRLALRVVAQHADLWNVIALPDAFARHAAALRCACAEVGRDPERILRTAAFRLIIRDSSHAVAELVEQIVAAGGDREDPYRIAGSEEFVAEQLSAYQRAGARGIIAQIGPPYDRETLERLVHVSSGL